MGRRRSNGACPLLGGFGPSVKVNVQFSFLRLLRQRMKARVLCVHPRWAFNYVTHEKFELPQLKDHVKEGSNVAISVGDYFSRHCQSKLA